MFLKMHLRPRAPSCAVLSIKKNSNALCVSCSLQIAKPIWWKLVKNCNGFASHGTTLLKPNP